MSTETERKTFRQRLADSTLQMTATPLGQQVERDGPHRWEHWTWRCTIRRTGTGRRMTIPFRMGMALTDPPRLDEVLQTLLDEAAGFENAQDVEDWCSEFGYELETSADRRKYEALYNAVRKQTERLKNLLGDDYEAWLWETDRD